MPTGIRRFLLFTASVLAIFITTGQAGSRPEGYVQYPQAETGDWRPFGDVNGDGLFNIFDLVNLLGQLRSSQQSAEADIDSSGVVDIFDVLALLGEFAYQREIKIQPFEALVTLDDFLMEPPRTLLYRAFSNESEISCNYHIYCNRRIRQVEFVIGGETLREVSGKTPVLVSADPDTIYEGPYSSLVEMYSDSEPIDWQLKIWAESGEVFEDSGQAVVSVLKFMISDFHGSPNTGLPIVFPLVLHGSVQQFGIGYPQIDWATGESADTFLIDLNKDGRDSVVFDNIDELSEAIMEEVIADSALWNKADIFGEGVDHTYVTPGYNFFTAEKTNRLTIMCTGSWPGGGYARVVSIGNNEKLMNALGFPKWRRQAAYFNKNFGLAPGYYQKYDDR